MKCSSRLFADICSTCRRLSRVSRFGGSTCRVAEAASLIFRGAYDRKQPAITHNRTGKGIAYFLGCDLDVNDPTTLIRLNLDATSAPIRKCFTPCVSATPLPSTSTSPAASRARKSARYRASHSSYSAAHPAPAPAHTHCNATACSSPEPTIRYLAQRSDQSARYPDTSVRIRRKRRRYERINTGQETCDLARSG